MEAEQTQSVNTIILKDNNLEGHNTDITGFAKAIKKLNFNLEGKKVFILGAGGVVPSIIFALNTMKVSKIIISNRTRQKYLPPFRYILLPKRSFKKVCLL